MNEEITNRTIWDIYQKLDQKLTAECGRLGERIPYISENGRYRKDMREVNNSWWTNGFWAGMMWQMYHSTGNEKYKETARYTEAALDQALADFTGLHHDVGFQFLHTAVADYRLTGRKEAKARGLHAANLLAGRFHVTGDYIRAWNLDRTGWMIVDSLMNIPLLYWAGEELKDPGYADIADRHAHTAMRVLQRPDGSCSHIAVFEPTTGELLQCPGGQGYGPGSSWSRGQAWAIYGFALAFSHTGRQEYLDAAKRTAHYFLANLALTGCVPL
ncbi:MAG: glycoside hydrolase family 88 protein, partial [Eubacteriales bacterium]|nr:glycoside hydrolase family 88 protein [Eubacteriales bacterium]